MSWIRSYVDSRLGGIYEASFDIPDKSVWRDGREGGMVYKAMWKGYGGKAPSQDLVDLYENQPSFESFRPRRTFRIHNARPLQESHLAAGGTLATFFDEHGFVLVNYPTRVTDWSNDDHIRKIYQSEIDDITRNMLFPGQAISGIDFPGAVLQRGAEIPLGGTNNSLNNPNYAGDVHQDCGRTPKAYIENTLAYNGTDRTNIEYSQFAESFLRALSDVTSGVDAFMQINFWRTMRMADHPAPLTHLPLALLDGATIELQDLVPTALLGFSKTGAPSSELAIRHNPNQRWCYYPNMTCDEIIVLKQFQWITALGEKQRYSCPLHVAFKDHSAPKTDQRRRNCEYRIQVSLGSAAAPRPYKNVPLSKL